MFSMRMASGVIVGLIGFALFGCKGGSPEAVQGAGAASTGGASSAGTTGDNPSAANSGNSSKLVELKIEDVKVGTGEGAKEGDKLTMTYTGKLANGFVFDSNDKPGGQPFVFKLGAGTVIKGWDQGLLGMKVGGERKLSIPSDLGYGARSQSGGKIPPNSDLFFDVKLKKKMGKDDLGTVLLDDKKVGTGPGVEKGDTVTINYTSTDDSDTLLDERKGYSFKVGGGKIQSAVDKAILGMKVGGERVLTVPGELMHASPLVHPGMTATIDLHLLSIHKG